MVDIILLVFLAFRNSARAKIKGQNPLVWGLITVGAIFMALLAGGFFVIFVFCRDSVDFGLLSSTDPKSRDIVTKQLQQALGSNVLHGYTIFLFGFGGFLLVRYLIDSKPDKKKPEVHWMDKMEEQKSENS